MFAFLERYFAYRRLKPIVVRLPARLEQAFGSAPHYTFLQARRAIADVGIGRRAVPHALAAACTLEELARSDTGFSADEYQRLRDELTELFGLASADFTMERLRSRQFNQHHPAAENEYASGGHP